MSELYVSEPPTSGKVLVTTTVGEIDIELWPKECPKAVRNFVQLCAEGYYNGCIFHRVIKGFMAQTGDPTGTGQGGESIYGEPFKDEFHSRLKFARRGMVGMASSGRDTNASQFFITFDKAEWLNKQNTLFGRVAGDTVFNVLKLQELEVEKSTERPLHPAKIIKTEILSNPFPDIRPRSIRKSLEEEEAERRKKKKTVVAKKDTKLLSFGEEADAVEAELQAVASATSNAPKSSHDLLTDDPRLLAAGAKLDSAASTNGDAPAASADSIKQKLAAASKSKKQSAAPASTAAPSKSSARGAAAAAMADGSDDEKEFTGSEAEYDAFMRAKLLAARGGAGKSLPAAASGADSAADAAEPELNSRQLKAEYAKLKRAVLSLKKTPTDNTPNPEGTLLLTHGPPSDDDKPAASSSSAAAAAAGAKAAKKESVHSLASLKAKSTSVRTQAFNALAFEKDRAQLDELSGAAGGSNTGNDDNLLTPLQLRQQKFSKRKKLTKNREAETLAKLEAFQKQIRNAAGSTAAAKSTPGLGPGDALPPGQDWSEKAGKAERMRKQKQDELQDELKREKAERRSKQTARELELLELLEKSDDARSEVIAGGKTASAAAAAAADGDGDGGDADAADPNWLAHPLKFAKRPQDFDAMARRSDEYEYTYSDPRLKADIAAAAATRADRALPPSKRREAAAKLANKTAAVPEPDAAEVMDELRQLEAESTTAAAPAAAPTAAKRSRPAAAADDDAEDGDADKPANGANKSAAPEAPQKRVRLNSHSRSRSRS